MFSNLFKKICLVALVFGFAGALAMPLSGFAQADNLATQDPIGNLPVFQCAGGEAPVVGCVGKLLNVATQVTAWLAGYSGRFMDYFIYYSTDSLSYAANGFTRSGWEIARDFSNILYLFSFVLAGFQLILGLQSAKKVLVAVATQGVLAVIGVFTWPIAGSIVDFGNFPARVFLDSIVVTDNSGRELRSPDGRIAYVSPLIVEKFNPQSIILKNPFATNDQDGVYLAAEFQTSAMTILLLIVMIHIYMIKMFWRMGWLFLGRTVSLFVIMIFGPIAFATKMLPIKFDGRTDFLSLGGWFKKLIALSMIAPITTFFLYLIALFLDVGLDVTTAYASSSPLVQAGMNVIVPGALIFGFLKIIERIAKEAQGPIGDAALKLGDAVWKAGTAALATGATVVGGVGFKAAGLASRAAGSKLAKNYEQKAFQAIRGTGKYENLTKAQRIKEAERLRKWSSFWYSANADPTTNKSIAPAFKSLEGALQKYINPNLNFSKANKVAAGIQNSGLGQMAGLGTKYDILTEGGAAGSTKRKTENLVEQEKKRRVLSPAVKFAQEEELRIWEQEYLTQEKRYQKMYAERGANFDATKFKEKYEDGEIQFLNADGSEMVATSADGRQVMDANGNLKMITSALRPKPVTESELNKKVTADRASRIEFGQKAIEFENKAKKDLGIAYQEAFEKVLPDDPQEQEAVIKKRHDNEYLKARKEYSSALSSNDTKKIKALEAKFNIEDGDDENLIRKKISTYFKEIIPDILANEASIAGQNARIEFAQNSLNVTNPAEAEQFAKGLTEENKLILRRANDINVQDSLRGRREDTNRIASEALRNEAGIQKPVFGKDIANIESELKAQQRIFRTMSKNIAKIAKQQGVDPSQVSREMLSTISAGLSSQAKTISETISANNSKKPGDAGYLDKAAINKLRFQRKQLQQEASSVGRYLDNQSRALNQISRLNKQLNDS